MLKPKPVLLKEEHRPDFWTVLRRRKRSIRNFLDSNQIQDINSLENWIALNSHEYLFSDVFISEVKSHFKPVTLPNPVQEETVETELKVEEEKPLVTEMFVTDELPVVVDKMVFTEMSSLYTKEKNNKKKNKN